VENYVEKEALQKRIQTLNEESALLENENKKLIEQRDSLVEKKNNLVVLLQERVDSCKKLRNRVKELETEKRHKIAHIMMLEKKLALYCATWRMIRRNNKR
jgi:DNA repair exonuclease SbcCD ATPase subunit